MQFRTGQIFGLLVFAGLLGMQSVIAEMYKFTDKDGIACDVGAGQLRPIGKKWEDGREAFVFAALKRRSEKR